MSCLEAELLAACADGEAAAPERARAEVHLAGCAGCRERLEALCGLKEAVRAVLVPPMPERLRARLEALIPQEEASGEPRAFLAPWRYAFGTALALAGAAVALRSWKDGVGAEVPVELALSAHHQYARVLPLAETEAILAQLPEEFSSSGTEEELDEF